MSWTQLSNVYSRSGIILALGAGVSLGSALPTWSRLLGGLADDELGERDGGLFQRLREHGFSMPAIASLLEQRTSSRAEFVERLRDELYRNFPFYRQEITKSNRRQLVGHVRDNNPTLRAVAGLCAVRNADERTYSANRRVHAIVSFNLDALLQGYTYARYEKRILRTIERPSKSRFQDKINIYHMHGYLRFDQKAGDPSKEATDTTILTEQDYFDFFNDSTSMFNYTFLYLLREFSCLFIGLSMQDDNIRRLLHYSRHERMRALAEAGKGSKTKKPAPRHYAVLERSGVADVDTAIDDTLAALGTSVLWLEDYSELPLRLEEVYRSAGDDWSRVF